MEDDKTETNIQQDIEEEIEKPLWLQATVDDILDLDFEGPIADNDSADCRDLSRAYFDASKLHENLGDELAAPAARIFAMLSAVTDFHFKSEDRHAPYGAKMVVGDTRSSIPEDFRGGPLAVLADAAARTKNVVLRGRLSDVCWLLERKRYGLGKAAIGSYVEIVERLGSGQLKEYSDPDDDPMLGLVARDSLRRALTISRTVGWDSDEAVAARKLVPLLRDRAVRGKNPVPVLWFCEIDLDLSVSDPSQVAAEIEVFLQNAGPKSASHVVLDLWRLAVRAYAYAKEDGSKYRCQAAAAEALVAEAESESSAMLASHRLSAAIAEYHGVPDKRERRTELRHRLIDIQSRIPDEMSVLSNPIDLSDIAKNIEDRLTGERPLLEFLLIFAGLERSPSPEKLAADAIKAITDHPLSSMFGASFHDHEGKVIHRSEGAGFGANASSDAIRVKIAQNESLRRGIFVTGEVQIARQIIVDRFYIGQDIFEGLLRHSPFVPHDLCGTYSRGFARFFQGDFVSALYILTPLLENSLRHVLKIRGHDVTTFDDAKQTQEDRTISALFEQMRPELDETFGKAITADIDNVFLSKPGPSLRHALAHGLLHDGSPYSADAIYACWLIFRLCCIPLFQHHEHIELPS